MAIENLKCGIECGDKLQEEPSQMKVESVHIILKPGRAAIGCDPTRLTRRGLSTVIPLMCGTRASPMCPRTDSTAA